MATAQVFKICRLDTDQAMDSQGQFGNVFEELRERIEHMTKLTKRAHHVLQVLMHKDSVEQRPSSQYVQTERQSVAEQRKHECAQLLNGN